MAKKTKIIDIFERNKHKHKLQSENWEYFDDRP